MNTTTNFGLKTYQSGDYFNPLTIENANMEAIDIDMKAIEDKTVGRATELVSQGVHAITLLDEDCKTFKFVATANYTAGETFTVNGIQANVYTPSGSALTTNAYVTGSVVMGSLNSDNTAITFYVSGSATADDSLKLGGELPSYYATQSDMTEAQSDITNLENQAGNTSIVGIGDGTLTGAVSTFNTNLNDLKGAPVSLLSSPKTTTGNFSLEDDITKFRALVFSGYNSTSGTVQNYYIPVVQLRADTTTRYQVFDSDGGNRTILISYVNDTTLTVPYIAGATSLKSVYGVV